MYQYNYDPDDVAFANWPEPPDPVFPHSGSWGDHPIYLRWYFRTEYENPGYWGQQPPDGGWRWMAGDEPSPFSDEARWWVAWAEERGLGWRPGQMRWSERSGTS